MSNAPKKPWNRIAIEVLAMSYGILMLAVTDGLFLSVVIVLAVLALFLSISVRLFNYSGDLAIARAYRLSLLPDAFEGLANVGDRGLSHTPLLPCGKAVFGGKRVDVIAECEFIDKGKLVRVVERSRNRVVVRHIFSEKS